MTYIDRNSESRFEHADCKYSITNVIQVTLTIFFNTGHCYGIFENGALQTILERFHIWEKVTGAVMKSLLLSPYILFFLWQ